MANQTGLLTLGTGLVVVQGRGLLLQQDRERAFQDALSSGLGQLFHGQQVAIESGSPLALGSPGNDFSPLVGKITDIVEFLGS
jgi:hypothetical protein